MKARINLFCLPFAGGNKYSYQRYLQKAQAFLNIIPLEYPGRGARINEPLISNMEDLVTDLYNQVKKYADQSDYAIYGHSMGGLAGYLLARKLIDNNHRPPLHLFITGTSGPSSASRFARTMHLLPAIEFIRELQKLDGILDEIVKNEDMINFIEPILRADFKACETYQYHHDSPLQVPFTVITGTEEEIRTADIYLWQKETIYPVDFRQTSGKHFFIFRHPGVISDILFEKLSVYSKAFWL